MTRENLFTLYVKNVNCEIKVSETPGRLSEGSFGYLYGMGHVEGMKSKKQCMEDKIKFNSSNQIFKR